MLLTPVVGAAVRLDHYDHRAGVHHPHCNPLAGELLRSARPGYCYYQHHHMGDNRNHGRLCNIRLAGVSLRGKWYRVAPAPLERAIVESHDIVIVVVGLCSLGAAVLSYMNGRKLNEVHLSLNSRLDALVASTAKASYAAGHEAAQIQGADRARDLASAAAETARVLATQEVAKAHEEATKGV